MTAANSWPAAGTDSAYNPGITGVDAERITPARWTVEATFRPTALGGNQTIVGRDGSYPGLSPWGDLAALYLSTRGTDLAIEYVDVAGNDHNLQVAVGLANNTWYHVAATSDGSTLRLWLNGSEAGSLSVAGSPDSALARGLGIWSVSRGMFNLEHTDRFSGLVDAVAVSDVALVPGSFVTETFGAGDVGFNFNMAYHGLPGAPFGGDANTNGVPNGMEYFLGWDPADPLPPSPVLTWSEDHLSVSYPYNPLATGVSGSVEWTTDLTSGVWSGAGVSYSTNASLQRILATLGTSMTNQLFVRLRVGH